MSVHTSIHRCRWAIAAALLACGIARADIQQWPVKPALEVPYTSLFGTAYTADTKIPAAVIAAARGDAETGLVVLHVRHHEEDFVETYKGYVNSVFTVFDWNYRTGKISYQSTTIAINANGLASTNVTTTPSGIWPGELAAWCSQAGGSWTTKHTVTTRCALVHVVNHPAKSAAIHAWSTVKVGAVFATKPVPAGCEPETRKPRVISFGCTIPRNGSFEFDLKPAGFRNEMSASEGSWALFLDQPAPGNPNAPTK